MSPLQGCLRRLQLSSCSQFEFGCQVRSLLTENAEQRTRINDRRALSILVQDTEVDVAVKMNYRGSLRRDRILQQYTVMKWVR